MSSARFPQRFRRAEGEILAEKQIGEEKTLEVLWQLQGVGVRSEARRGTSNDMGGGGGIFKSRIEGSRGLRDEELGEMARRWARGG